MASLTDDNEAGGNLDKRNIWLIGVGHTRVCLKIAFRQMRVTVCGRFGSNEGGAAGYVDRMRAKYTAKWGVYLAGMNFQTCSSTGTRQTVQKFSS